MTTTTERPRPPAPPPGPPAARRRPGPLDRPLTSYHLVLGSTALLVLLGLVMVLSASSVVSYEESRSSFSYFERQALWVFLGTIALAVGLHLPVKTYRWLGYPLLLASVVGLVLVLVPGIGVTVGGSTRWIDLGPLRVQPSEPAKLALVLWGADLLVRKERLLGDWKHLLVPLLPVATGLCVLVMLEPDLGTTLCLVLVLLGLLWVVGTPLRIFGGLVVVVFVAAALAIYHEPYRLARVLSFRDPFADADEGGYQAVQGVYALASGGWWGVGLGQSAEKWDYLPNAHTDFIFAIIGEELGLVGTLLVLLLFATLAVGCVRVARRTSDPFARLVAGAVTCWLIGQAVINMGAVCTLLPITGIPLPLISFGGSALVVTMFALGMVAAFAKAEPGAAAVLQTRPPALARARGLLGLPPRSPRRATRQPGARAPRR